MQGNYFVDEVTYQPDPYIGLLNGDLTMIEEMISDSLPPRQARFLFDGITHLISSILIGNIKHLKNVNQYGVKRLLSNILSLQQNLISFSALHEKDLDRAKKYFSLLQLTGPGILEFMERNPGLFSYEEYKAVLDLLYNDLSPLPKTEGEESQSRLKEYFVSHRF
jgi:exocyst complex component 4